jgi:ATP-binding cassette subfamily F protein 3
MTDTIILVDLNALAWLEDYLQTWPGTLLVVYVYMFLFRDYGLISHTALTIVHSCEGL